MESNPMSPKNKFSNKSDFNMHLTKNFKLGYDDPFAHILFGSDQNAVPKDLQKKLITRQKTSWKDESKKIKSPTNREGF